MKWSASAKEILEDHGYLVINIISSSKGGIVDLVALRNGIVFFIECKEGKDIQSYLQKRFAKQIIQKGGTHILAQKEKLVEFLDLIK
jgi:Holliday junction resolvase